MELIRRNTDYALRCLIYMAFFPNGKVLDLTSVAKKRKVPLAFLHKIFQKLAQKKIVLSHRGVEGGFSLAKNPAKVSVREVIEILQGPILLNRCLVYENICKRSKSCSIKKSLSGIQKKLNKSFAKLTLKELAKEE